MLKSYYLYVLLGTLIRRHRVPLPPPYDDQFYTVDHFNVGKEINIYSKVFKIIVSRFILFALNETEFGLLLSCTCSKTNYIKVCAVSSRDVMSSRGISSPSLEFALEKQKIFLTILIHSIAKRLECQLLNSHTTFMHTCKLVSD